MTNAPLKMLVVSGDETEYGRVEQILVQIAASKQWKIEWTSVYQLALDHICAKAFDIYIVDLALGDYDGISLLREAIEMGCVEPFILLTDSVNASRDQLAMETGAMDYLDKDTLTVPILERSIRYALERYHGVQVLRWNENLFRQLFEHSHDAIFLLDEIGRFQEVNPAMQHLLCYSRENFSDMSLQDIAAVASEADNIMARFNAGKNVTDAEITILSKDDEAYICLLSLNKVKDMKGKVIGYGLFHNISAIRKAEKANLLVEKLSTSRRLTQYLAHEIKNPVLNIQLSSAQLEKLSVADGGNYVDIINRNADKILQILHQLLHFTDASNFLFEKLEGALLIENALQSAEDSLQLKKITLNYKSPAEKFYVWGDRHQLSTAFLNIIHNAIDAMPAELPLLTVSVSLHNDKWIIRFTDNGKGIEPELQQRIFDPYFSTKETGTGLGLTATLFIIESHKGTIDVISHPGTGTTIVVTLPKWSEN